jgi:Ni/Co efflux regulator RcnB
MTRFKILAAAAAIALGASSAWAQTGGDDPQHGGPQPNGAWKAGGGRDARNHPVDASAWRGPQNPSVNSDDSARRDSRRGYDNRANYSRGYDNRGYDNRGYNRGYNGTYANRDWSGHRWQRGERLPREYNSRYYVVDDWRGHHLRRPPSGYHWVQSGGDYLLVAIATGIIASVLLNQ